MTRSERATAKRKGLTYKDVVAIGTEFPGVEESTSYGTPALKVHGKLIVRLREDRSTLVLATTHTDRDLLIRGRPRTYFLEDHYMNYPYVLVRLAAISRKQMRGRIEDAWRRFASRSLIEALSEG